MKLGSPPTFNCHDDLGQLGSYTITIKPPPTETIGGERHRTIAPSEVLLLQWDGEKDFSVLETLRPPGET